MKLNLAIILLIVYLILGKQYKIFKNLKNSLEIFIKFPQKLIKKMIKSIFLRLKSRKILILYLKQLNFYFQFL